MIVYAYCCFLAALTVVAMKTLNINGRVGENVTINCSDWNTWFDVKSNVKYFCNSPCSEKKDIILKAAYGKTAHKKEIELTNSADGLFVTFTNLQKSDSKKYYCGVERNGPDTFIEVNLKVTRAESSSPKTAPKTAISGSTLSFGVTNNTTMSSYASDNITDLSTPYILHSTTTPSASATQGDGPVLYLIIGVIVIITILMILLRLMRKMMKKELKVVSSAGRPQEDAQENVEYDEIRSEDQQTGSQPTGVSAICFSSTNTGVDPDSLYANYSNYQDTELAAERGNNSFAVYLNLPSSSEVNSKGTCAKSRVTDPSCDFAYSVAQLPKEQIEPTGQFESNENECLYSLAEL